MDILFIAHIETLAFVYHKTHVGLMNGYNIVLIDWWQWWTCRNHTKVLSASDLKSKTIMSCPTVSSLIGIHVSAIGERVIICKTTKRFWWEMYSPPWWHLSQRPHLSERSAWQHFCLKHIGITMDFFIQCNWVINHFANYAWNGHFAINTYKNTSVYYNAEKL